MKIFSMKLMTLLLIQFYLHQNFKSKVKIHSSLVRISVCRGLLSKNNDQKTENNRYCQKSKSKNENNVVEIHQKEGKNLKA